MDDDVKRLQSLQEDAGIIARGALLKGGDKLMDKAMSALGVAYRHFDRIERGSVPFSPAVEAEIRESLNRGRLVVEG